MRQVARGFGPHMLNTAWVQRVIIVYTFSRRDGSVGGGTGLHKKDTEGYHNSGLWIMSKHAAILRSHIDECLYSTIY